MPTNHRQRFIEARKGNAADHQKMVDSPAFQNGTDIAMLEYAAKLTTGIDAGNVNSAMARHFCLLGAEEFLEILRTLADPAPRIAVFQTPNLNHQV